MSGIECYPDVDSVIKWLEDEIKQCEAMKAAGTGHVEYLDTVIQADQQTLKELREQKCKAG